MLYLEKGDTTKLITDLPSGNLQIEFTGLDAQGNILSSRITNVTLSPGQTLPVSVILGVSIMTDGFFPSTITVYKGDTLVFVNNDTVTHSFSIPGLLNSGDIAPGGSYSYTFGDTCLPAYTCTREDGKTLTTMIQDGAYAPEPTPTSIPSGMVIPGTALNSPVLNALVSQYGQITRPSDTLSKTELESVVKNAYAVGIDLSMLYSASAANDAVIQTALRVGTPIVFENISALTSFLAGQQIDPTVDVKNAVASMAAAIGVGVESQVAVVIPSIDPNASVAAEIYCIGSGSMVPYLPAGTIEADANTTTADIAAELLEDGKSMLPSISELPDTDPASLMSMVSSVINSATSRTSRNSASQSLTASSTQNITVKNYLLKYPEYTWCPNNRGQDFVIQCAIRLQMYLGKGGQKKWVRFIVDDTNDTAGFLNRGSLVFDKGTDKGYFIGGAQVQITTSDSEVNFSGRSPGYWLGGAADSYYDMNQVDRNVTRVYDCRWGPDYDRPITTSQTSIDVDYLDSGSRKTENFTEERQFRADEFEGRTWPGADWRMRLRVVRDDVSYTVSLGCAGDDNWDWKKMFTGVQIPGIFRTGSHSDTIYAG